jgi:hypothetical protein
VTAKTFSVHSSDGATIYTVIVEWNGKDLNVACNCKAGALGDWCRHKNYLLNGCETILAVKEDLTDVLQWVRASPVYAAMSDIQAAEIQQKEAEASLKKAKAKVQAAKRAAADLVSSHRKSDRSHVWQR